MTTSAAPLAGVRIVEIASFVAVPLAGMTLAQLGAEVIRVDPIGGGADYHRWPVADTGTSIYWSGLNKGVRSVAVDLRADAGQRLVQRLIADAGVLITNVVGRQWHSYETLTGERADLIHVEVSGRGDGSTGVDYTVNAAVGFPMVTGPAEHGGPINHVLPAWDVTCGLYVALGVIAAVRRRDDSGAGGGSPWRWRTSRWRPPGRWGCSPSRWSTAPSGNASATPSTANTARRSPAATARRS
ncbi:2-methylfumaryl-CoA isomerase [Mycobacterium talmoniae]|uniref:2-methylfumaryl-CoA isomerase n=1 Tax=Mycobacterium talmoniae TaxID=1858794 RepID=A0A2S8BH70_9MYCO|nr:2-methylfumaryl-CoA isomerase [Mycobacterium talmoniae]